MPVREMKKLPESKGYFNPAVPTKQIFYPANLILWMFILCICKCNIFNIIPTLVKFHDSIFYGANSIQSIQCLNFIVRTVKIIHYFPFSFLFYQNYFPLEQFFFMGNLQRQFTIQLLHCFILWSLGQPSPVCPIKILQTQIQSRIVDLSVKFNPSI